MEFFDLFLLGVFAPFLTITKYTLSFVVILSVIVFSHEFGHYIVAKLSGVKIETFSIGFGKEIWGWNDRSGTRWKLSWLPLGGYVKMFGDIDPASSPDIKKIKAFTKAQRKIAFHTKPLPVKAAIVAAGPIANFLLGIIILTCFYMVWGKPVSTTEVSKVMPGSAAEQAGIKAGDIITKIDDTEVITFDDLQKIVGLNTGYSLHLTIARDKKTITLDVTPLVQEREDLFGNKVKLPMLGIYSGHITYQSVNIASSVWEAVKETGDMTVATLKAVGQMITGQRGVEELSGPIRIAEYSGQSFEKGFTTVLWLTVLLSINLGLINLFPIPLLDGGHLLYYSIEAIQGKPVADSAQKWGARIGVAILAMLVIVATWNDIKHVFGT